jgi:hypothetical protein
MAKKAVKEDFNILKNINMLDNILITKKMDLEQYLILK